MWKDVRSAREPRHAAEPRWPDAQRDSQRKRCVARGVPPWRRALAFVVAIVVVGITMAGCGGGAVTSDPDFAGPVDIGNGRALWLECRGSGSPTVVLVTGLGERADNWMTLPDPAPAAAAVFPSVAGFTRVCAYDRPGTTTAIATGWALSRSTRYSAWPRCRIRPPTSIACWSHRGPRDRSSGRSLAGRPHRPPLRCRSPSQRRGARSRRRAERRLGRRPHARGGSGIREAQRPGRAGATGRIRGHALQRGRRSADCGPHGRRPASRRSCSPPTHGR